MTFFGRALDRLGRDHWRVLWAAPAGRTLLLAALGLVVATFVALVVLWPGSVNGAAAPATAHTEAAQVISVTSSACQDGQCRLVTVRVLSGGDRGRTSVVTISPRDRSPKYTGGQRIRVLRNERQAGFGLPGADPQVAEYTYSIVDYDRRMPMLWLAVVFAALVILAGRLRGLLSLVGFGVSLLIVTQFVVPAIIDQRSAFLVALVGSLAAMLVTIALTSGLGIQSLAAALGIAASLLVASLLGLLYVHVAHLTGHGSELATTLSLGNPKLSLQGLVLAGFVIGALGVLADMAVTQASAVMALRRANPDLAAPALYREAFVIGRDHLSATVNTLVFAYVGASLPLLLIFKTAGITFTDAINGQDVAESIVATLVGSIGVIASVPFTTGLAALLASSIPADAMPVDDHGHHH